MHTTCSTLSQKVMLVHVASRDAVTPCKFDRGPRRGKKHAMRGSSRRYVCRVGNRYGLLGSTIEWEQMCTGRLP